MSETEKIKSAGDYELVDVKIGSAKGQIFDVANFVIDINIYEDMFSPTMSGNITLNDAQDLINLLPMIGEERLLITFKTPSMGDNQGLYEQEFYIYKMTDREYSAERAITYTLHFVSFETVRDLNSKISKGFAGNINSVVELILTQELRTSKKINIEKTKNTTTYVSNFWTPFTNINFLAKRSISQETESANFLFFETNRGFNYISVDTLLTADPKTKYIYDNNSRDPSGDGGGSTRDIAEALSRIQSVKINTAFDYMNRIQSGMYKSRLITHEIVTKTYNVQTMSYDDEFKKHNHLNPYPLSTLNLPSKTLAFLDTKPRALENFNNFKSDKMKTWHLKNIMQMSEINAYYMDMTVPGRSDLCVGDIVDIYMYRPTPFNQKDQEEQLLDKTFSGRYMIASLCHNLNREKHEIHMSVVKDSLIVNLQSEGSE